MDQPLDGQHPERASRPIDAHVSASHLRLALEAAAMAEWDFDLVTGTFAASPRLNRLFGFPADQHLVFSDLRSRYHPEDAAYVIATSAALPTTREKSVEYEYRIVLPGGEIRWLFSRGEVVRAPDGTPVRAVGVLMDITDRKRAEDALRDSEARFRAFAEASREGVAIHDGRTIVEANVRFAEIYGYALDEVIGRDAIDFVAPGERAALARAERWAHEEPYETVGIRKDGTTFPIEIHGTLITYRGRSMRVGIVRDLTAQRAAEAALRDSETRLSLAVAATGLGIWDWDTVAGTMTWSERAKEIYGFPPGAPVTFQQVRDATHPEDLPRTSAMARQALDPAVRAKREYEYRIVRPDDGAIRWIVAYGEPVFATGDDGVERAVRYTGTIQDITDRKHAADELKESETRLRVALDAAQMAPWALDLRSGALTSSPQLNVLFGLPPDRAVTADELRSHYHPEHRDRLPALAREAIARGDRYIESDYRIVRADGAVRWLFMRAEIVRDAGGQPLRMLGVVADITERKQAEETMELVVDELSHRVKNTLAVVSGIADQMLRGGIDSDFGAAFQGRIRALAQTHALLSDTNWAGADLHALLTAETAPHDTRRITLSGAPLLLPPRIAQTLGLVLHELATNAAKYGALSMADGRVGIAWEVRADGGAQALRITWTETGGPPVAPPARKGFGSTLIERGIAYDLDGTVDLTFEPTGLRCTIDVPFPAD